MRARDYSLLLKVYTNYGAHPTSYVQYLGSSPGVKEPGREVDNSRDFRLPPPCKRDLKFFGLLRSVDCQLGTDVSGQPIGYETSANRLPFKVE